ncbi:MAG TPA: hypothetical protein VNS09_16660 [Solirubrobacter sp.]|nr:hypothetical protein [Solirubrobacter sp.]
MLALALAAALALPAPGNLLVEAPSFGLAIVAQDGHVTRLGRWYDGAWSADGSVIAAVGDRRLVTLDDRGRVRWRLPRREPAQPDWSSDGARLAYRDGAALRVVRADGRGDHARAARLGPAGPRWRPGARGQLAYADARGVVRLLDGARTAWTSDSGPPVRPYGLRWSADGTRLAAISGSVVRVFDGATGRLVERIGTTRRNHFQLGVYAGGDLVLVRHDFSRGTSVVTRGTRTVLRGRGSVSDVTASPDGAWLLLGRRYADRWELRSAGATREVHGVTRRINPGASGRWAFPIVRGWSQVRASAQYRLECPNRATSSC